MCVRAFRRVRSGSKRRSGNTDSASSSTSIDVLHGEVDSQWGGEGADRQMDARERERGTSVVIRERGTSLSVVMTATAYEELKLDIAALMDSFLDDMLAHLGSRVLVV